MLSSDFNRQIVLNQQPVSVRLRCANSFMARLKGLLFFTISSSQGIEIKPCNNVHSFGMGYTIDVVFIDKNARVIKLGELKPNQMMSCFGASSVVELSEGSIKRLAIKLGDQLTHRCDLINKEVIV